MSNTQQPYPGTVNGTLTGHAGLGFTSGGNVAPVGAASVPTGASAVPAGRNMVVVGGSRLVATEAPGDVFTGLGTGGVRLVVPSVKLLTHSFLPPVGTPIYATQAISFSVEPDTGNLTPFVLKVDFDKPVMWEVAFDSVSFSPQYEGSSATTEDGIVWRLTVLRKGGWPSSPTFSPIPVANIQEVQ